jgi:hypothetical protein
MNVSGRRHAPLMSFSLFDPTFRFRFLHATPREHHEFAKATIKLVLVPQSASKLAQECLAEDTLTVCFSPDPRVLHSPLHR